MKNPDLNWIKNNIMTVQATYPRTRKYEITFAEIERLYGDRASKKELEDCLRDLEKQGSLKRKDKFSKSRSNLLRSTYVFVDELRRRLREISTENSRTLEERRRLGESIQAVLSLQNVWSEDIPRIGQQNEGSGSMIVFKVFIDNYWHSKLKQTSQKMGEVETKLEGIEEEIQELKQLLDDS